MSLKKCVIFLIVANLTYLSYSQGWLSRLTGGEALQREPDRLKRQINEGAIHLSFEPAQATTQAAPQCPAVVPERWIVYMGPYATAALKDNKMAELKRLKVASDSISKPSLKIGLSLGEYPDESSARAALAALGDKGIRTATVLLWQASNSAAVDAAGAACR